MLLLNSPELFWVCTEEALPETTSTISTDLIVSTIGKITQLGELQADITTPQSWPGRYPSPGWGVPLSWGTPQLGTWNQRGVSPSKDMGPVVGSIMGWRWGNSPSPSGGQTENITFHHPSDAGGNNLPKCLPVSLVEYWVFNRCFLVKYDAQVYFVSLLPFQYNPSPYLISNNCHFPTIYLSGNHLECYHLGVSLQSQSFCLPKFRLM